MNNSKQRSTKSGVNSNSQFVSRPARKCPAEVPEQVSVDVLAVMTDEDLSAKLRSLDDDRAKVDAAFYDPRYWEEEIAYVRREMQIRNVRRKAHEQYTAEIQREIDAYNRQEFYLPVADVDNTAFLRSIGELN